MLWQWENSLGVTASHQIEGTGDQREVLKIQAKLSFLFLEFFGVLGELRLPTRT